MPNYNRVLLMGNLTRDPEMRFLPSNMPVVQIGMAINRRWRNQQGEQQEEVTFVDCEGFGKTAEFINQYFKKGRPIFVEGRLKLDQWQDKKDGQNRSKLKVVIESAQFVDSRPGSGEDGSGGSSGGMGGGAGAGGAGAPRRSNAPSRSAPPPGSGGDAPAPGNGGNGGGEPHQPVEEDDIPF